MKTHLILAGSLSVFIAGALPAAVPLFEFEQDTDVAAWKWASKGRSKLERVARFATAGESSLMFTTPAWKPGMPEWPAFEARPPVANWTAFDRLVVDITNPGEERCHFALFVSDSKVPFRKGLSYTFDLASRGFRRFVVPLTSLPKEINRADIAILHFFAQRPPADLTLYLDSLILLRPGESLPEPGAKFAQELGSLAADAINAAQQSIARSRAAVASPDTTAELRKSAQAQFARLDERIRGLQTDLAAPGLTLARLNDINAELAALPRRTERTLSVIRFQKACSEAGLPASNMLVGIATSMEKILPREAPFDLKAARDIQVSLARNEKESFQVMVLPMSNALRKVTVSGVDLRASDGAVFKREHIQCDVVGYVETKSRPPYAVSHVGWWPDPILDFLGPVEIAAGDLQAFWIRVRAPKGQPPGLYRGTLTVAAEGVAPVNLGLSVRVHSFTLPDHSPLPLAITFGPHDYPTEETQKAQADWRQSEEYPINAWKKHKLRWADFLADYYINYDSLYRHGPPDFEVVKRLRERGQLVAFNLGIFDAVSRSPDASSNALAGLRTAYDQAKALGVLEQAYIYGFDECQKEQFPLLEKCAQTLRREFPGALLLTTSYDDSYGLASEVKTIDAWCPLTPSFKSGPAARARATGRQVWWYICCGPHHPHANMFIEYPAIEGRLLMGALAAQQRPDGFLYYQISIWNSRKPISAGPFTDWDPRSWTTYHGDGAWTCVGPGGTPLPTIRLENFRDGLEDFAYAVILEDIIRQRESQGASLTAGEKQWLAEAKAALPVPASLAKTMTDYAHDPAVLYAWRNRLGDLIDRSGAKDVNPWGRNFGVRGFPARR